MGLRNSFFLWCLIVCRCSFAAGPLVHLYLAERYCQLYEVEDETWKEDFLVGTLFPDIRYIFPLSREETHPSTPFEQILSTSSGFEAGMRFHVWVDQMRERFVCDTGIYAQVLPYTKKHRATLLKWIEEEILFDQYEGERWSHLFDRVWEEETERVSIDIVEKWHFMIRSTLNYHLSSLLFALSDREEAFGISNQELYEWSYLLPELVKEEGFQLHVKTLLRHLESELFCIEKTGNCSASSLISSTRARPFFMSL